MASQLRLLVQSVLYGRVEVTMRSLVVRSLWLAMSASVGLFLWGRPALLFLSTGVLGVGFWWFGRCHHPRPLSLLPPITDEDGLRTPAQWFCAQCGEHFPANFEHERLPIPRFSGYDESKVTAAARRAADLEPRQRRLALRRAEMAKRRPAAAHPPVTPPRTEPVPISDRRRAG